MNKTYRKTYRKTIVPTKKKNARNSSFHKRIKTPRATHNELQKTQKPSYKTTKSHKNVSKEIPKQLTPPTLNHSFSIPHNNVAYQKATLLSILMINKPTLYYDEKAKTQILFPHSSQSASLSHPTAKSKAPSQLYLNTTKTPREHPLNRTSPYSPKKKRFSKH